MKKICVYGKGGIGKSTTVTNVAAAMADFGLKVAVIGCDPKADTTRCLIGKRIPTILDILRGKTDEQFIFRGYKDILCIEAGGPEPGTGCAGRGIVTALQEIQNRELLSDRDVVIYDVLGDVVCGGFSMPLREGIAEDVYLVTTADFMALYAANNICRGIKKYAVNNTIRLSGLIYNGRSSRNDSSIVHSFAKKIGSTLTEEIPMSMDISKAELKRKTVIELNSNCEASNHFRNLAKIMLQNPERCIPSPLTDEEIEDLCQY